MITVKDILYAAGWIGGGLLFVAGVYWRIHFRLKEHDRRIASNTARIEKLECGDTTTARKLGIIERNLVRIMEHLKIEPVRDLFEE